MNIEPGEYFVVAQGPEYRPMQAMAFPSGDVITSIDGPVRHDRSWNKYIFRALEVCGDFIAAEVVFNEENRYWQMKVGERTMIRTNEMKVWPVTEAFVKTVAVPHGART